jgi:hypothetical protein
MNNLVENGIVSEQNCQNILGHGNQKVELYFTFEEMQQFLIKRGFTIFTHKAIFRSEYGRIWEEKIVILAAVLNDGKTFLREKMYNANETDIYFMYKDYDIRTVLQKEFKLKLLEV